MSEKELPPLRVRLLGDDSDFKKMVDSAKQGADALAKAIDKTTAQQSASAVQDAKDRWKGLQMFLKYEEQKQKARWAGHLMFLKYEEQKRKEIEKTGKAERRKEKQASKDRWRGHQMFLKYEEQKRTEAERTRTAANKAYLKQLKFNSKVMEDQTKQAERTRTAANKAYLKQLKFNSKVMEDQTKAQEKARKDANKAYIKQLKFNSKVMEDQAKAEEKRVKDIEKWLDKSAKEIRKYEEKKARDEKKAADKSIRDKEREERKKLAEQKRMADAAYRYRMQLAKRFQVFQESVRKRSEGRADMGFGLGARADIYMHTNALRSLMQSGKSFMGVAVDFEQSQVAIEAFTGSAAEAQRVMSDIQDYAIASPYQTVQLADMARNMMSYGLAADAAVDNLKMLGDVAGGSDLRLERLAFAMSQITSMGRLQGQELRQLTEQGFNPLETMSRKTGLSMMTLKKAMEDGQISIALVNEALKVETSAGGRFAAMAARMQNSIGGMTNQLRELLQKLSITIVKVFEKDLKKYLLAAIERLKQFMDYIETPAGKEAIRRFVEIAKNVLVMAMAFHTVGLAIAVMRWQVASLATILSVLQMVMLPLKMLISALAIPLMLVAHAIQVFLTGSIVGFAGFAVSLLGAVSGVGLLGIAIAGVRDLVIGNKGFLEGFKNLPGLLKRASDFVQGFFYNFQTNVGALTTWIKTNWDTLLVYSRQIFTSMLDAFLNNIAVTAAAMAKLFTVALQQVMNKIPAMIETLQKALSESSVTGDYFDGIALSFGALSQEEFQRRADARHRQRLKNANAAQAGPNGLPPGLFNDLTTIGQEWLFALRHGIPGKGPEGLNLPEFKLDRPELKFPEMPEIKLPEAFTPDFSALGRLAEGSQAVKLTDTAVYGSADHAKRAYEYTRNMEGIQAGLRGEPKKEDLQQQQLKALQGIEKNTRPGVAPQVANLSPN